MRFVLEQLAAQQEVQPDALDSIPFFSLCRGLLLPLLGLGRHKTTQLFGTAGNKPPKGEQREQLLAEFIEKPIGLKLEEKLGCLSCDPFYGRASTFRQDRLLRLLLSCQFVGRSWLLDRLAQVGDVCWLGCWRLLTLACDVCWLRRLRLK